MVEAPVCVFAPDEEACLIRLIKEAALENALMKPCAVETETSCAFYIAQKITVILGGIDAGTVIPLVKHEPLINPLAVYAQAGAVHLDFSHAEIAFYPVASALG